MFAFKKFSPKPDIAAPFGNKKGALGHLVAQLADIVYPARCMICETYTEAAHGLCPDCWSDTSFIANTCCCQCGTPLPGQGEDLCCDSCLSFPPSWNKGAAAVLYDGGGRKMVLALKYGDRLDLAPALAGWLMIPANKLLAKADLIAPVPLHRARFFRRSYNQSAELSRHLARQAHILHIPDLLLRHRKTPPQEGLDRVARIENQRGAFCVSPRNGERVQGKSVLLVDDVLTTGATLSACSEALYDAGAANVDICVLARVDRER